MKNNKKLYLGLNFDGTVVTHKFPIIGDPIPGAIQWIKKFQEIGFLIILNMRSDDGIRPVGMNKCLTEAVEYLKKD